MFDFTLARLFKSNKSNTGSINPDYDRFYSSSSFENSDIKPGLIDGNISTTDPTIDTELITYVTPNQLEVSSPYTTDRTFVIYVDKSIDSKLENGNTTGVTLQPGVLIKSVTMVLDSKNKRPVGVGKFKINLIDSETKEVIKTLIDENSIINNGTHNNNSYSFNLYDVIPSGTKDAYLHVDYKTNPKLVNSKCSLFVTIAN